MNIKYINLNNRAIIYIKGPDRKHFLQGLITNDVNNIAYKAAIYAAMLSPQGRFLYDFFVTEYEERLLLICNKSSVDELIKKLRFYKLRSNIEIGKADELSIMAVLTEEKLDLFLHPVYNFADPRNLKMGYVLIGKPEQLQSFIKDKNIPETSLDEYNYQRIKHKIADSSDLVFEQSFILEYGFDNLNAIDYNKGCYVGQELTARTHYRGQIRKKIFLVEIESLSTIQPQAEIMDGDKKVGIILSSVFWDKKLLALALIKNVDNNDKEIELSQAELKAGEMKVKIVT